MTSSFAHLLQSIHSPTTKLSLLPVAVQTRILYLILYAEWLIPIAPHSLGSSCKHTACALRSTPFSSASTVHWYDFAQMGRNTPIIGSQGSRISFRFRCGHNSSLGLGHHDVSFLTRCLLFLSISHLLLISKNIFRSGVKGSVRVDAVCQCRLRHPGDRLLYGGHQYNASLWISPSDCCFTGSSRFVGHQF